VIPLVVRKLLEFSFTESEILAFDDPLPTNARKGLMDSNKQAKNFGTLKSTLAKESGEAEMPLYPSVNNLARNDDSE